MPTVTITDEAVRALQANARGEFKETGHRNADGTWDVPLTDDTIERLEDRRHPQETISDTIIRIAAYATSSGRAN